MSHPLAIKLALSGGVGSLVTATLQVAASAGVGTDTILIGTVGGVLVLLFGMFLRQGTKLAAVGATIDTMQLALAKLDTESRTVDKRDGESRHLVKNELQMMLSATEERLEERLAEVKLLLVSQEERLTLRQSDLQERVAKNEERIARHLEGGLR